MTSEGKSGDKAGDLQGNLVARQRFSRQQVWILMGLSVLILGVYGVLGALILHRGSRPTQDVAVSAVGRQVELRTAYEQARTLASSWQSDAQLVGATTSWQLAAGDSLTLSRPAWSFSFYSPAARQVQIVTVNVDGAQANRQIPVRVAPSNVEADWDLDSGDLLLIFMAYGGKDFMKRHSRVNIHFQLKGESMGRSIWYLTAIDPVARESFTVSVDALSRQVLT